MDFWAGYISGAIGILVGNPLDIVKTRLQAGTAKTHSIPTTTASNSTLSPSDRTHWTAFARGAAAPILGYGALNALLFLTYNRSLSLLNTGHLNSTSPENPPPAWSIWTAGALGGLATFVLSAPTELVKCRAQILHPPRSSWSVTQDLWKQGGLRGLYVGGGITSVRDAVGYGFYFWSYEVSKRAWVQEDDSSNEQTIKIMLCGGLAGVVTWASIFPLDVVKTRVQTWGLGTSHVMGTGNLSNNPSQPLLGRQQSASSQPSRPTTYHIAKEAWRAEGGAVFFRGLGVCSARAFIVNAVQWAVYEWMMETLKS